MISFVRNKIRNLVRSPGSENEMINTRKRNIEPDSTDSPSKKCRRIGVEESIENTEQKSVRKKITNFFNYLVESPGKNYFLQGALSAISSVPSTLKLWRSNHEIMNVEESEAPPCSHSEAPNSKNHEDTYMKRPLTRSPIHGKNKPAYFVKERKSHSEESVNQDMVVVSTKINGRWESRIPNVSHLSGNPFNSVISKDTGAQRNSTENNDYKYKEWHAGARNGIMTLDKKDASRFTETNSTAAPSTSGLTKSYAKPLCQSGKIKHMSSNQKSHKIDKPPLFSSSSHHSSQISKQRHAFGTNFSKKSTAEDSIHLEQKEQYRLLLQQYISEPLYDPKKSLFMKETAVQTESRSTVNKHQAPIRAPAFSTQKFDSSVSQQFAQYIKLNNTSTAKKSGNVVNEGRFRQPSHVEDAQTHRIKVTPSFLRDDNGLFNTNAQNKETQRRLKTISRKFPESSPFSDDWIKELRKSLIQEEISKQIKEQEKRASEYHAKREAQYLALEEKSREKRKQKITAVIDAEKYDDDEEDIGDFAELTPEMEAQIEDALRINPPEEVLADGFRLSVTRKDMETLSGLNWLNDEIINFYMNLIMERSKLDNYPLVYAFNTFFYPKLVSSGHTALKRWTRKIDIFSYGMLLVPVHMGMHWCLAVIDFRHKKIQYYDSMGGQNNECLNALRHYLQEESLDKRKQEYDMSGWSLETVKNIPQQMNGSDCGMFAMKYAEYISRDAKLNFTQGHMPYFRRRMVYEILKKSLL